MDRLWSPWRYAYVTGSQPARRAGVPAELEAWPGDLGCVFCNMIAAVDWAVQTGMDREAAERSAGIVTRGEHCFLVLNAFPYASGHVMAVPYEHTASLAALPAATAAELMSLMRRTERALRAVYQPHGINMGINLGQAAGAGVAAHLHVHALPRWEGDTNFMTVIGETRVIPESLTVTWERMRSAFADTSGD